MKIKIWNWIKRQSKFLGIALGLILLYFTFRETDFYAVLGHFQSANIYYLILSYIAMLFVFLFKGIRWYAMIKPVYPVGFQNVFSSLMIGYFFHNILPLRMGELVRVYYLSKKENVSKTSILGSVLAEKFFDFLSLLIMALLIIFFKLHLEGYVVQTLRVLVFLVLFITIIYIIYHLMGESSARFLKTKIFFFIPEKTYQKIAQIVHNFFSGFKSLNSFSLILKSLAYSIVIWLFDTLSIYLLFLAFGVSMESMLLKTLIPMIIINLGVTIPASPGDIGTFHSFGKIALVGILGMEDSLASIIVIFFNLFSMLPGFMLGGVFFYLHRDSVNLKEIEDGKHSQH